MFIEFRAPEYHADGSIRPADYVFDGSPTDGWNVRRDHQTVLRLGPGYRALAVSHCGICATDLARRHLPFPLPQVTGHEVVCHDEDGTPLVVEINASHVARGLPAAAWCAHCRGGLAHHCPDRLVLGIHALPGGFGPWLLAPTGNLRRIDHSIDPRTATLVEPFAAALHAVRSVNLRTGERVAVIGPGRLGSLVVAALAADRAAAGLAVEIIAIGRRPELLARARSLGADAAWQLAEVAAAERIVDVAIDTTGSTEGLALALRLATREVHVKSTTGQPTAGLTHLTELVVDEISVAPLHATTARGLTVLAPTVPATVRADVTRSGAQLVEWEDIPTLELGGADTVIVTTLAEIDWAIRPQPTVARGIVRARGTILVADVGQPRDVLLAALLDRGLRLSTSRCGDFAPALDLLRNARHGLGRQLGPALIETVLPADRLADAFVQAGRGGMKIVVAHPGGRV